MRLLHLVLLVLTLGLLPLRAQELRATVELRTEALGSEGQIHYEGLRRQLTDLLGRTRWTDLAYKEGERIDVSFIFTLHERSEAGEYKGELIISARRPIYGTDYMSPTLLLRDPSITFTYLPGDPLTYQETEPEHPLVALCSFYALYVIASDLDSFSPLGGSRLQPRLSALVASAMSHPDWKGWSSTERGLSRARRLEYLTSQEDERYRQCWYRYHREGLDRLSSSPEEAREVLLEVTKELVELRKIRSRSVALSDLEQTKLPELIQLFRSAPQSERLLLSERLRQLFPTAGDQLQALR